ncbi:hypothetical protein HYFRA_00010334 [Hymenoscyphus fraxineus]|uniref:Uncharacterized protein n=1 Tax=Hymenoscyphus fraxineus TaxID=746836 RepID=A0A9N9L1R3_9HELO|nr:hypothetical protein HYFRA_00010334 [Hymenoscyphus fraxineus]
MVVVPDLYALSSHLTFLITSSSLITSSQKHLLSTFWLPRIHQFPTTIKVTSSISLSSFSRHYYPQSPVANMQFFTPAFLVLMAAGATVMATPTPQNNPPIIESERVCVGGAIVCSYSNGENCIVPCTIKCRCPANWSGGHNTKSGCGIIDPGGDQCLVV